MRSKLAWIHRRRARGVAAIELALVLPFLAILVLALVDYGYYFYIGINATEAARAAAAQATTTAETMNGGAGPTSCTDPNIGLVTSGSPAPSPLPAPAQAGVDYMTNQVSSAIGNDTLVLVQCATTSASPAKTVFSIQVQVTFPPPSGAVHFGLPKSGNNLVYKTSLLWRWY
ncbi:MAG TPA: TadE/TadG family type IV pilus assembly protein [Polyangia bacterium]|nr:TadE/TadG family type IV pilus assembly protein [Polyangia bacterium]